MANPTTNFGWVMPTSSSLVTNLPADFNTFGQAVDTSMADLKGGTTGQILSKATNTDMDFTWITNDVGDITAVTAGTGISGGGTSGAVTVTNSMATAITTAGDLIKGTGSGTFDRLGIGSSGQVLTVTAGAPAWATPSASGYVGVSCYIQGTGVAYTDSVARSLPFATESFDTNTFHDNSTNNSRITIPTGYGGKYLLDMSFGCDTAGTFGNINLYKNGSNITNIGVDGGKIGGASGMTSNYYVARANAVISLAAGDYIEFYITIGSTVTTGTYARFGATFLGA